MVERLLTQLESNNKTVHITGHSQGGATAGLISMYLWTNYQVEYETILFAPVGSRCIAHTFADQVNINYLAEYPWIQSYVDSYDLVPAIDWIPGTVCRVPSRPEAKDKCEVVFRKVVELMVDTQLWSDCRIATHQITHYWTALSSDDVLYDDGSTSQGCFVDQLEACPIYNTYDGIYLFFVFFNFVALMFIFYSIFTFIRMLIQYLMGGNATNKKMGVRSLKEKSH